VLILVVVGTAVVGMVLGARTARLYARFAAELGAVARRELGAQVRVLSRALHQRARAAEVDEDWSALQAALPELVAGAPDPVRLCVTDAEGLVLADVDRTRNGQALEPRLRGLLDQPPQGVVELTLDGKPTLVEVAHVSSEGASPRLTWVIADAARVRDAQLEVVRAGRDAVRYGWLLVGLGGLLCGVVALGVVVLVGSSVARRLQTVSWRIGQLGRGDRSTHLILDGPTELRRVGAELDLAARRIAVAESEHMASSAVEAVGQARGALVETATALPVLLDGLAIGRALPPSARGDAVGAQARADGSLVWLIEVHGDRLEDLLVAAELQAAAGAIARGTPGITAAALLARLDDEVPAGRRARALVVAVDKPAGGQRRLRLASAAARFPIVHRADGAIAPIVVRGDRIGEDRAQRGAEVEVTLAAGDALYLVGDAAPTVAAAREGHLGRGPVEALRALGGDADVATRAATLAAVEQGIVVALVNPRV
jgi:hypothetical protein